MADNSILKKVLKNLKNIAVETGKEAVGEAGKITESVITGKELLGNIKPLSEQEMAQKKYEDEKNKQSEMADIRSKMSERGRNVEAEVTQVVKENERKEDDEERVFLENLKRQREAEIAERNQLAVEMGLSTNPAKKKKKRGSAFAKGKKKTSAPDPSQMSQTGEYSGKME